MLPRLGPQVTVVEHPRREAGACPQRSSGGDGVVGHPCPVWLLLKAARVSRGPSSISFQSPSSVPGAEAPSPQRGSFGRGCPLAGGSQRQAEAEEALGAARRWSAPSGRGPRGVPPQFPQSVCGVSTQLKTQLERTEATLEGEQALRQKLTAEFEEVRPCSWSSPVCQGPWGVGQESAGRSGLGPPPPAPALNPRPFLLGVPWRSRRGVGPPAHAPLPSPHQGSELSVSAPGRAGEAPQRGAPRLFRSRGGHAAEGRSGGGGVRKEGSPGPALATSFPWSLSGVGVGGAALSRPLEQGPASFGRDGGWWDP